MESAATDRVLAGEFDITHLFNKPGVSKAKIVVTPHHNEKTKEVDGTVSVSIDISDKARELEETVSALRVAVNAKSAFLAMMSHEIRTPLNGIVGFLQLLEQSELSSSQQESVAIIHRSADNLLRIINSILDFCKLDSGANIVYERQPFQLKTPIDQAMSIVEIQRNNKDKVIISSHIALDVPTVIIGDRTRLHQIILNLLHNATKFTEAGAIQVNVRAAVTYPTSVVLKFEVIDSGPGIPPESIKLLFQPFSQAKLEDAKFCGGTGLGLAVCKKLVDGMKGDIGVDSAVGKGSRFWFCLPFDLPTVPFPVITPYKEGVTEKIEKKEKYQSGGRVLVVEDNLVNAKVLVRLLAQCKVDCDVAENGQKAVDMFTTAPSNRYRAILMDLNMPVMSGTESTFRIRKWESEKQQTQANRIPIIAVTADLCTGVAQDYTQKGFDDFLGKPILLSRLLELMIKWKVLTE